MPTKKKAKKKDEDREAVFIKRSTLEYQEELQKLQVELLKLQKFVIDKGLRLVMLFEGRDAAGKGGTIKRIMEFINPRSARVVALTKPSDTERTQWYFQRYVAHLPAAGEMVLFDRSWYNRAMVEPVMGFCSDEQNKRFLKDAPLFEQMLVKEGISLFKFYFSVSRKEQAKRFKSRETDPLKQFKISPVDQMAQELWEAYTVRKFQMLNETNRSLTPWTIIRSDDKKKARINCMKVILNAFDYPDRIDQRELAVENEIVISGIDELKHMEENLRGAQGLPG